MSPPPHDIVVANHDCAASGGELRPRRFKGARHGIFIVALLFCSCASRPAGPFASISMPTLTGDGRFPAAEMATLFPPAQWQALRELEYEAFVIMDAQIRPDGSLRLGKVTGSYPDASWHALARSFSEEAALRAAAIGSHIDPAAEVYVVFFKRALDGNLALIFARQKNDPAPGMTQRALYLHTRRY